MAFGRILAATSIFRSRVIAKQLGTPLSITSDRRAAATSTGRGNPDADPQTTRYLAARDCAGGIATQRSTPQFVGLHEGGSPQRSSHGFCMDYDHVLQHGVPVHDGYRSCSVAKGAYMGISGHCPCAVLCPLRNFEPCNRRNIQSARPSGDPDSGSMHCAGLHLRGYPSLTKVDSSE